MYETLRKPPVDTILQLALEFREDARPDKIDLGIGVYRDAAGRTPVMRAVKTAEAQVHQAEDTKAYLPLAGDDVFNRGMVHLLFGPDLAAGRTRAIQTVGGGAAIRLLVETIKAAKPDATVWVSDPTWINHLPIVSAVGLQARRYRYLDRRTSLVDFEGMRSDLQQAVAGDVVLLHGCCHNPSGADLNQVQWRQIAADANLQGYIPFIDIAYQGFGDGLEADAWGIRLMAREVPELMVAASCSKNFGVYRDRVGCAVVMAKSAADADLAKATLLNAGRVTYSFPANHGAAVIATILENAELREAWHGELESMRQRMLQNRHALAEAFRLQLGDPRFDHVRHQRGMFSMLGLTVDQIVRLQREYAIFMPPDGRINIAGLQDSSMDRLTRAVASVV